MRNNGQSRFTNQRGWRCAAWAAVVAASIGACRTQVPEEVLGSRSAPEDDWFCDAGANGEWACVQDETLVANPDLRNEGSDPILLPAEPEPAVRSSVLEWHAGHYAVQLIALESEEAVAGLTDRLAIAGLLQTSVESDGRRFHVLLVGPYAERSAATGAAASLVRRMPSLEPWVRSVGTLQDAVRRAQHEP